MIQRIAIMGCGSLGTILGAFLSKAGLDVTMVDAWKEHVDVLNEKGATVVEGVEMTVPVKACTPDQMNGDFDLFIYMAKQTFNDTAIPQMIAHCHKDTIICTCQNGLPELAVAKYWPRSQVYGAPVGWPATLLGPGKSALTTTTDASNFCFHLGTLEGPVTPQLLEIQKILECMCPGTVFISEDLMADRWSKVLINAAFSGMSTVVAGSFYDGTAEGKAGICAIRVAREVVRVCNAQGIVMPPIFGKDFRTLTAYQTPEEEIAAARLINLTATKTGKASMLQDLEKGRKCEISVINGVVSQAGREFGVPTPYCDAIVKIVSEVEDGKRPLQNNLDAMPDLPFEA